MNYIEKKENKKYYREINAWRGLIILLVVLGHSVDSTKNPSILGFIHSYIYIFHMPALFVISGFLFYKARLIENKSEQKILIKDKAIRLLIPYLTCTAISVVLKVFLDRYAKNPLDFKKLPFNIILGTNNPNGGIWFLYILFILSVVAIVTYKINIKALMIISIVLKIGNILQITIFNMPLLSLISNYAFYYFFGIFIFESYEKIKMYIEDIKRKKIIITMEIIIVTFISYINVYYFNNVYLEFILTLILIYISYKGVYYIKDNKFINMCGKNGMSIYVIGYYIQQAIYVIFSKIIGIDYSIYWVIMFLVTIVISILINIYIIQKNNFFKFLLLGEKCRSYKNKY